MLWGFIEQRTKKEHQTHSRLGRGLLLHLSSLPAMSRGEFSRAQNESVETQDVILNSLNLSLYYRQRQREIIIIALMPKGIKREHQLPLELKPEVLVSLPARVLRTESGPL